MSEKKDAGSELIETGGYFSRLIKFIQKLFGGVPKEVALLILKYLSIFLGIFIIIAFFCIAVQVFAQTIFNTALGINQYSIPEDVSEKYEGDRAQTVDEICDSYNVSRKELMSILGASENVRGAAQIVSGPVSSLSSASPGQSSFGVPIEITGNDIADTAQQEAGYVPAEYNSTPYHDAVGVERGGDWCGYFCQYIMQKTGHSDLIPLSPGMANSWTLEGSHGAVHSQGDGYIPQAGDVITFDPDGNGFANHVGIVVGVQNDIIHTIEGNTYVDGQILYGVATKTHELNTPGAWFKVKESGGSNVSVVPNQLSVSDSRKQSEDEWNSIWLTCAYDTKGNNYEQSERKEQEELKKAGLQDGVSMAEFMIPGLGKARKFFEDIGEKWGIAWTKLSQAFNSSHEIKTYEFTGDPVEYRKYEKAEDILYVEDGVVKSIETYREAGTGKAEDKTDVIECEKRTLQALPASSGLTEGMSADGAETRSREVFVKTGTRTIEPSKEMKETGTEKVAGYYNKKSLLATMGMEPNSQYTGVDSGVQDGKIYTVIDEVDMLYTTALKTIGDKLGLFSGSGSGIGGSFIWPIARYDTPEARAASITSLMGDRESPGGIGSTNHGGTDIAAASGEEVLAVCDGEVISADMAGGYGNLVEIDAGQIAGKNLRVLYAHNSAFKVKPGDKVKQGQVIALAGSTGNSTGPHVHLEFRLDGEKKPAQDFYTESYLNGVTSDDGSPSVRGLGTYCSSTSGGGQLLGPVVGGMSDNDLNLACAVILQEAGPNDMAGIEAVTSCVINRVKDGRYGGNALEVLTASGQFEAYFAGHYKRYSENLGAYQVQCASIKNQLTQGRSTHNFLNFRGYPVTGAQQLGGNYFFND